MDEHERKRLEAKYMWRVWRRVVIACVLFMIAAAGIAALYSCKG